MSRRIVSAEELVYLLNSALLEAQGWAGESEGVPVSGIYRLEEPDANGCNWIPGFYQSRHVERADYSEVVAEVQRQYNVAE